MRYQLLYKLTTVRYVSSFNVLNYYNRYGHCLVRGRIRVLVRVKGKGSFVFDVKVEKYFEKGASLRVQLVKRDGAGFSAFRRLYVDGGVCVCQLSIRFCFYSVSVLLQVINGSNRDLSVYRISGHFLG